MGEYIKKEYYSQMVLWHDFKLVQHKMNGSIRIPDLPQTELQKNNFLLSLQGTI